MNNSKFTQNGNNILLEKFDFSQYLLALLSFLKLIYFLFAAVILAMGLVPFLPDNLVNESIDSCDPITVEILLASSSVIEL